MKIDVSEVKRWTVLELPEGLYKVSDTSHMHKWRGSATYSFKVKNIQTGQVKNITYKAWSTLDAAEINYKNWQYLYSSGDLYTFMEFDTSELYELSKDIVEDIIPYLKDGIDVFLMMYNGNVIWVILPDVVEYEVTETSPWVKWDRAQAWTKEAVIETWLKIQVPLHIEKWDIISLNTSTNEFRWKA